ncbi:hypothetical protein [Vibrio sp. SCSIO 43137]|uniref:hypothetical protein n=1 Tax=Vibrio sp. SCSIO 43137 TaxID=3021011 RepID=UPI0023070BEE|nr:hypothetical protein [Vibrio sp. SCSIO 43137]WCE32248.1 hypothetical protein PK654_17280 [Vibrio sp. SCSIO 43137]
MMKSLKFTSMLIICILLSGCAAGSRGWDSNKYEGKYWSVSKTSSDEYSGYKKILQDMNHSERFSKFIQNYGLPDYIYPIGLWRVELIYFELKRVYMWDTHRGSEGGLIESYDLSEKRISIDMREH